MGLIVIIIILSAFFFHKTLHMFPEESLIMSIMSILFVVFVSGILGNTSVTLFVFGVISVIGLLQLLTNRRTIFGNEKGLEQRKKFFSPGIIFFLLGCGYAFVAFRGVLLHNWDELAQWGKAANYMVVNDQLINSVAFDGDMKLISSTTFFHYFVQKINYILKGEIADRYYYISNFLLWFSTVFLPFSGCKWKEIKQVALYVITVIILMHLLFIQPFYNIYCDQPCIMWTGGLIAWYMYGKRSKNSFILPPLILWNVSLSKSMTGPLFAVIATIVISIMMFFEYKRHYDIQNIYKKKSRAIKVLQGCLFLSISFIPPAIWSVIVKENTIIRSGGYNNVNNRISLTVKYAIMKIFVHVSSQGIFLKFSYFTFFIVGILALFLLLKYYLDIERYGEYKIIYVLYYIGFPIYWLILIYAYLTAFGYADSVKAASMERYLSAYMLLGVLPLLVPIFKMERLKENGLFGKRLVKYLPICIVVVLCLNIGGGFAGNLTTWFLPDEKVYKTRKSVKNYANRIKELTGGDGKIYMICQSSNTFPILVADFELGVQLKRENTSYFQDPKKGVKDIAGVREEDIEDFSKIIKEEGYSYLWIYKKNDYFEDYFKDEYQIKELENGDLFKIEKTDFGQCEFNYMINLKEK